jgi:protein O-mannosyl-transferase
VDAAARDRSCHRDTGAVSIGAMIATGSPVSAAHSGRIGNGARWWWLVLLAVLAVFVTYAPVWDAGFIWDDDLHVSANPTIVGPLGLRDVWVSSEANYFPLTMTSFWLQHAAWGLTPAPYHLVTIAFHALSGWLLWRVLRALGVRGAAWGAALWTFHPVQVDSVAWISELKNTQSAAFFLASIWLFLRWLDDTARESDPNRSYFLSLT